MKSFGFLGSSLLLSVLFSTSAFSAPLAQGVTPTTASSYQGDAAEVVGLYNSEVSKPNSPLALFLKELKSQNEDYDIADQASLEDVVRLESGGSGPNYGANYLLIIRGGFKRSTVAVAYLMAHSDYNDNDESHVKISIDEPVSVEINPINKK